MKGSILLPSPETVQKTTINICNCAPPHIATIISRSCKRKRRGERKEKQNGGQSGKRAGTNLVYEVVECLFGFEPLDLLVDSLVLLQILYVGPATVQVRATQRQQGTKPRVCLNVNKPHMVG